VTVISSSDAKLARAKTLGADVGVNYTTTPEWSKAGREITGGRGFDHIVELGARRPCRSRCARSARAARCR